VTQSLDDYLDSLTVICENSVAFKSSDALRLLDLIRQYRASGDVDKAIEMAIELGEEIQYREWLFALEAGERAISAGVKAAHATWGSPQQRRTIVAQRRSLFEQERPKFSSDEEAFKVVGERCGVSWRTIRRAVTGH
jgi:hypothetical protein